MDLSIDISVTALENRGDHRGWYYSVPPEVFASMRTINMMHVAEIAEGEVRGNHYHGCRETILVLFQDEWTLGWLEKENDAVEERVFSGTGAVLIDVGPGIVHAFNNTGTAPLVINILD